VPHSKALSQNKTKQKVVSELGKLMKILKEAYASRKAEKS
jgi:hypothetical protein